MKKGFRVPTELIWSHVEQMVGPEDLNQAWTEIARQWAQRLQENLGGDYQVAESTNCMVLSALAGDAGERLLRSAERAASIIPERLGDAASREGYGKHLLFLFEEEDDYYQYISYFYPEGKHPASSGVFLHDYYQHVAVYNVNEIETSQTITHELTHLCLGHLPIPVWLNEGLAMTFHRAVAGRQSFSLDNEMVERHRAFWNESTIQKFWAGSTWYQPGEPSELSYSLAEILMQLLTGGWEDFREFIQHAHYSDAGQAAAQDHLGVDLGETARGFVGEGDWRPNRKAIANLIKGCTQSAKSEEEKLSGQSDFSAKEE